MDTTNSSLFPPTTTNTDLSSLQYYDKEVYK